MTAFSSIYALIVDEFYSSFLRNITETFVVFKWQRKLYADLRKVKNVTIRQETRNLKRIDGILDIKN